MCPGKSLHAPVSMRRVKSWAGSPTPTDVVYVTPMLENSQYMRTTLMVSDNPPASVTSIELAAAVGSPAGGMGMGSAGCVGAGAVL